MRFFHFIQQPDGFQQAIPIVRKLLTHVARGSQHKFQLGKFPGLIFASFGALLLALVPELLRYSVEPLQHWMFGRAGVAPEGLRMLIFGFALVLVMRWRPAGLIPTLIRTRRVAQPSTTK